MLDSEDNNVSAAIVAGATIGEPKVIHDTLAVVVSPHGYSLKEFDLEKAFLNPLRKRGGRDLGDAQSFIAYVNRHKTGATSVYTDKNACKFSAVFNDHEPVPAAVASGEVVASLAGWGDFTASYSCPKSDEWKRWHGNSQHGENKKSMNQTAFAQFIEDNLLDIIKPASADMLLVSRTLEAKKDVKFASSIRLNDGANQFTYEEDVQGTANKGQMAVPELFTICIPVFEGGQKYEIDARLRYRIDGGRLAMWYELVRPHKTLEHAFNTTLEEIKTGLEAVPLYAQ
jgi:uncharacterized protein YfdQ (DUF2303 family)